MANKYTIKNSKVAVAAKVIDWFGGLVWGWRRPAPVDLEKIKPRHILVLQLDEIGDVLLSTPALHYLRKAFPQAKIDVAVRPGGEKVLAENPDVDNLITVDISRFSAGASFQDFKKAKLAAAQIRKKSDVDYDLGIDLRSDLRTIYILYKLGVKARVSQAIRSGGFWLTNEAPFAGQQHEVERKLGIARFVRKIDASTFNDKLRFYVSEANRHEAQSVLRQNGISAAEKFVVMHIFAGWQPKEWPQNRFAEMADYLYQQYDLRSVIIGTEAEARRIDASALNREGVINIAGQTSLAETAAIIESAQLFIGNDSGPMHLAAAVHTPVVALFGQNTPKRYVPWRCPAEVLYHEVECSPCPQTECKRQPSCMELIKVAEVKRAIDKLIS